GWLAPRRPPGRAVRGLASAAAAPSRAARVVPAARPAPRDPAPRGAPAGRSPLRRPDPPRASPPASAAARPRPTRGDGVARWRPPGVRAEVGPRRLGQEQAAGMAGVQGMLAMPVIRAGEWRVDGEPRWEAHAPRRMRRGRSNGTAT